MKARNTYFIVYKTKRGSDRTNDLKSTSGRHDQLYEKKIAPFYDGRMAHCGILQGPRGIIIDATGLSRGEANNRLNPVLSDSSRTHSSIPKATDGHNWYENIHMKNTQKM